MSENEWMNFPGILRRVVVGCIIGIAVIFIWMVAERVVSKAATEAPAPLIDVTKEFPLQTAPGSSLNEDLTDDRKSEVGLAEFAQPARTIGQPDEPSRATPYEIIMSRMNIEGDLAALVLYHRNAILSSEDDPEWARKMEKSLFAYVMQVAESEPTIAESITCRSAGCELQLSHGIESKAATRVLRGLREQFPSLRLLLDKPGLASDRILQLTYLANVEREVQ